MCESNRILTCRVLIVILLLLLPVGCGSLSSPSQKLYTPGTPHEQTASAPSFDLEAGRASLDKYLQAVVRHDIQAASSLLSPSLRQTGGLPLTSTPRFSGYRIRSQEPAGEKGSYRVETDEAYTEPPGMSVREYLIVMNREGDSFLVDRILTGESASAAQNHGALLFTSFGSSKPREVFRLSQIPSAMTPPGLTADVQFEVGRDSFGPLSLSPSLDRLLLTSLGTHGFLGIVALADCRLSPVDLYLEGSASSLAWSPDGAKFVAEVATAAGANSLILYDAYSLHRVETPLADKFPFPCCSLSSPYWLNPQRLCFFVSSRDNPDSPGVNLLPGWWELDIDTGTISQSSL